MHFNKLQEILSTWYLLLKLKTKKYKINPYSLYKFLLESQYWNREEMLAFQLRSLNSLVDIAYKNSEFYHQLYESIHLPLQNLNEFQKLPETSKSIIRSNSYKLIIPYNKYIYGTTSGSTGEPLNVRISDHAQMYRLSGRMRYYNWWGLNFNDRSVLIWGRLIGVKKKKSLFINIKQKFKSRYDISVFDLKTETIRHYYQKIESHKPDYIRGYKSAILQMAKLLDQESLKFKNFKLKLIIVTSEVLYSEERLYMEAIFGCRVANEYGSVESGLFAFDCPHGSMHIFEEAVYITVDKGFAKMTELHNQAMPLINYHNDDKIVIEDKMCSCGVTSRIIKSIEGRIDDFIQRPDGSFLSHYFFYYIMKELVKKGYDDAVRKYKVLQLNNLFILNIVKGKNYNTLVEEKISKFMYQEIGNSIKIQFKYIEDIELEKNGKLRFFIRLKDNEVNNNFDGNEKLSFNFT